MHIFTSIFPWQLVTGSLLCLITFHGCGLLSSSRTGLYDGPRGRVYLETVPERGASGGVGVRTGLDASHPALIEPDVIASLLRGLQIKETSSFGALLDTSGTPRPIFTKEEAAFLAPLLSSALAKASPSQFVVFELQQPPTGYRAKRVPGAGAGSSIPSPEQVSTEETSGALYVFGRSLHAVLTKFRYVPDPPDTIRMANRLLPDPTGLAEYKVSFSPAAALRPDTYAREALPVSDELPSFVIDYQALPSLVVTPAPAPGASQASGTTSAPAPSRPASAETPPQNQIRELKDLVVEKDLELERLRKELEQLKRRPPTPGQAPSKVPPGGKVTPAP
ncbi:hypothetical protein YTPLAS18_39700 [Nitrospira sp.]|nr:hypothetical protein YTPLAS18_39700 [Nitrospira sp.]